MTLSLVQLLGAVNTRYFPWPVCVRTVCSLSCHLGPGLRVSPAEGRLLLRRVPCYLLPNAENNRMLDLENLYMSSVTRVYFGKVFCQKIQDYCQDRYRGREMDLVIDRRMMNDIRLSPTNHLSFMNTCLHFMASEICCLIFKTNGFFPSLPLFFPSFFLLFLFLFLFSHLLLYWPDFYLDMFSSVPCLGYFTVHGFQILSAPSCFSFHLTQGKEAGILSLTWILVRGSR